MNLKRHSVKEMEDGDGIKIKQDNDLIVIRFDDLRDFIDKCDGLYFKQYRKKHNLDITIDLP